MNRFGLTMLAAALLIGCFDPVHEDHVDALGGEAPGVPQGPLHRPGQPCTVCHGGKGPGSPTFDFAGTAFESKGRPAPLAGATILLADSQGRSLALGTNDAGNFWVPESELGLSFPFWAAVEQGGERIEMKTPIFRARSCAECHADPPGPSAVGHVYLRATP